MEKKLQWDMLYAYRCPECGTSLHISRDHEGFRFCMSTDCGFYIREEKMDYIRSRLGVKVR